MSISPSSAILTSTSSIKAPTQPTRIPLVKQFTETTGEVSVKP